MNHSLLFGCLLLVGCGSTGAGEGARLGVPCQQSSACAPGLTCFANEPDEPSVCTRECTEALPCSEGFVCSDTDLGTIGDASHVQKRICAKACSVSGRGQCSANWTCNTAKGACEPS